MLVAFTMGVVTGAFLNQVTQQVLCSLESFVRYVGKVLLLQSTVHCQIIENLLSTALPAQYSVLHLIRRWCFHVSMHVIAFLFPKLDMATQQCHTCSDLKNHTTELGRYRCNSFLRSANGH